MDKMPGLLWRNRYKLIGKCVAGTAAAVSVGAAALNHKIGNDAVEVQPVVVSAPRQVNKIADCQRGLIGKQLQPNGAFCRFQQLPLNCFSCLSPLISVAEL